MKERASYIDAVKGVAILCITFLHFENGVIPAWLNTWIGLFMITTFYYTSGWVTSLQNKKTTPKELLKKRIKQLGVPYIWFSVLIMAFDILWVLFGFMETEILLRDLYKTITLRGIGTLWFLPVLLIGELLFCSIRNSKHKFIAITIGVIILILSRYLYYDIWAPLRDLSTINKLIDSPIQQIVRGIAAWPVIAVGYLTSKYIWGTLHSINKIALFVIGITVITFSLWLVVGTPPQIYYLNEFLSYTLPALGFICIFASIRKNPCKNFFIYWGINSLVLMCTHLSIIEEIIITIDKEFLNHAEFIGPRTILYFVITIIISYPLVKLFDNQLRFMIEKK